MLGGFGSTRVHGFNPTTVARVNHTTPLTAFNLIRRLPCFGMALEGQCHNRLKAIRWLMVPEGDWAVAPSTSHNSTFSYQGSQHFGHIYLDCHKEYSCHSQGYQHAEISKLSCTCARGQRSPVSQAKAGDFLVFG